MHLMTKGPFMLYRGVLFPPHVLALAWDGEHEHAEEQNRGAANGAKER